MIFFILISSSVHSNELVCLPFINDRISFYAKNPIAEITTWGKMVLCRNILRHLIYQKLKHVLLGEKTTICFLFNTISIFGSLFPDQKYKAKYKLQKKKDGIIFFTKEDICLDFTPGDSFYQRFVYIWGLFLDHSYSIYLFFFAANVPHEECF